MSWAGKKKYIYHGSGWFGSTEPKTLNPSPTENPHFTPFFLTRLAPNRTRTDLNSKKEPGSVGLDRFSGLWTALSIGKNEEDKETEIRKIQEVLNKLENLLKEEEDCKVLTKKELEKFMIKPKEIIKSPTMLRKPFSSWRG